MSNETNGEAAADRVSALEQELERLKEERLDLDARIAGVEAELHVLTRARDRVEHGSAPSRRSRSGVLAHLNRTDAIVEILESADDELSIQEVIDALERGGFEDEKYSTVAATLNYLVQEGRISRLRRGRYAPAWA